MTSCHNHQCWSPHFFILLPPLKTIQVSALVAAEFFFFVVFFLRKIHIFILSCLWDSDCRSGRTPYTHHASGNRFRKMCIDVWVCASFERFTVSWEAGCFCFSPIHNVTPTFNFLFHSRRCITILIVPSILLDRVLNHKLSSVCPFPFRPCFSLNLFYKKGAAYGKSLSKIKF